MLVDALTMSFYGSEGNAKVNFLITFVGWFTIVNSFPSVCVPLQFTQTDEKEFALMFIGR